MKDRAVASSAFSHPLWKCYTVFDGLAGMRVEDICQDQRGFIWVATADGGVSRFDGVHFDNLTCAEGLPYPTVNCIAQTEDGRMWFGTFGGGLAAWDGSSFQVYTVDQGLPSNRVRRLYAGAGNTLQVVTWDGVCTLAEGRCSEMLLPPEGLAHDGVFDVATDAASTTWLALWGQGFIDTAGRRFQDLAPDGRDRLQYPWKLARDPAGGIWIASKYTGSEVYLHHYDPREERLELVEAGPAIASKPARHGVLHVRCDARGRVWATHRGVLVYDGEVWEQLPLPFPGDRLSDTKLTYEDREGNIWVGFWGGGLALCDPYSIRRYREADGLPDAEVTRLAEDREGRIWIGTMGGLACRSEAGIAPVLPEVGMVLGLLVDAQGKIWCSTDQGQLYCWDGHQVEVAQIVTGTQDKEIKALCQDRQGRLWVGVYMSGLGWLEQQRWQWWSEALDGAQVLFADHQGRLWIGRHGSAPALYYLEGDHLETVPIESDYVYALCQTRDDTVWIGTGNGLLAYREGQIQQYTVRDGLTENAISALAVDQQGMLWIGTSGGGAVRYDGQTFQVVRLGSSPTENMVDAILVDRRNQVWFGTSEGLVAYQPGTTPPCAVIRQVVADQVYPDPQGVSCPEAIPQIRIVFQGISFRSLGQQLRYSHRLQGAAWSPFTADTEAVYAGLVAGEYCFEVRAMDRDGLCSAPAALSLTITPDPRKDHLEALERALSAASQPLIGSSPAIEQVLEQLSRVGGTDMTVMILGETGTGKGLAARLLHQMSRRKDRPFLQVNCGALPEGVIASELFGHEKGAFTGAVARKLGRFELATGGTLFLDEIGDLPLDSQRVLLQVLEDGTLQRVGGEVTIGVDVRVIAATNRDLREALRHGAFREDLFFRLNAFTLEMPPLRQRREDIPLLVGYFAERFARHLDRPTPAIGPEVITRLWHYDWPGNVRELEHLVQRAVLLCQGNVISVEDLLMPPAAEEENPAPAGFVSLAEYQQQREEQERRYLEKVLAATGWVIYGEQGAAKSLGVHPEKLRARIKKYGLSRPS